VIFFIIYFFVSDNNEQETISMFRNKRAVIDTTINYIIKMKFIENPIVEIAQSDNNVIIRHKIYNNKYIDIIRIKYFDILNRKDDDRSSIRDFYNRNIDSLLISKGISSNELYNIISIMKENEIKSINNETGLGCLYFINENHSIIKIHSGDTPHFNICSPNVLIYLEDEYYYYYCSYCN
jgi:hypothetical protein